MNPATTRPPGLCSFRGPGQPSHTNHSSATILLAGALAVCLLASTSGCTSRQVEQTDTIKVIATILPLADFVQHVGGDRVDVTVMVPPGASPHVYEPTPGQMVDVSKAEVYVKAGSGIEFEIAWLDKLVEQNRDMRIIDCSQGIAIVGGDPHIWNSPANASKMAENICEGLVSIDPSAADSYRQNLADYNEQLAELDSYMRERFAGATERHFMMYHPSFGYLASQYELTQIAVEHEGKTPTPQVLRECVDLARIHNLNYVFVGSQMSPFEAESVAEAIGAETILIDPLPGDYVANMRSVADAITRELE
jgi:zinc transport system substrate-binding protein